MIVYYSGTGNSRYCAKMMADALGDEVVNAVTYMRSGERAELSSDKPWVFFSPVYVSALPRIFEKFLSEASFSGCKKAYFVMTCAGGMGASPVYCEEICKKQGLTYMGTAQVEMPQNYLVFFKTKEKAQCDKIIAAAEAPVLELAQRVKAGTAFDDPGVTKFDAVSTRMIIDPYYKYFISDRKFAVSDSCIGCGLCQRSCPLNNITLTDGKPVWGGSCTHCMACINLCPKQAIEYGRQSKGKPRYRCPEYRKK